MSGTRDLMFGPMARYYDLLYSRKDYGAETQRLEVLVRHHRRSRGTGWLDVACGTGRHLAFLRHRYAVLGVDRSPEMLRIARKRLPGVTLRLGDMRTFRYKERFDVVTCMFSAIGHLRTERDLSRTFGNFARHLKPGGVMIVEPWLDPGTFTLGHTAMVSYQDANTVVVRASFSSRRGNRSVVRYCYLIAESGKGIRFDEETSVGLMVSRGRLLDIMRRAGLKARFVREGLTPGRGLLLGTKPRTR